METETAANKAIIRRLFDEALNQERLELLDELFSADFIDHSTPQQRPRPEGVRDFFIEVRSHFPDIQVTIEDMIAEGNRVVARTAWRSSVGASSSASGIKGTLIQIFHLENGRIVEEWNEGSGPREA
ncbi:MAG TPA: ester cyclase [Ktedonosporobacter sp.]|jgi:predicted SnoaL-like aldol condensation-catalyzing enzyme|nr:ester cyclase [Ktedonosporobacter sp.]